MDVKNAGRETIYGSGGTSASIYNITVTTELVVKVTVNSDGKASSREFTSLGEYTGNQSDLATGQRSVDLAIERTLMSVDRFLDNVLGAAAAETPAVTDDTSL